MIKDKNSIASIVRMRRIAKGLSWWIRGKADTSVLQDGFTYFAMGIIVLTYFNLPSWCLYVVVALSMVATLYIGYWDSEKGFRQLQNEYEGEDMSPPIRKINEKLDKIIEQTKKDDATRI